MLKNYKLSNIKPESVFRYFEEISSIPRGSGNTAAISNYLVEFAKKHSLLYVQDTAGNVIIFKAANNYKKMDGTDYTDIELIEKTVMLQGHMDMVNQKTETSMHDFTRDGLELYVDGDYLHANNTTLGADDGIAVAYILAILEDDTLRTPPIEAVITVDEEIGLLGASALDVTPLNSRYMINLDSEDEGKLLRCCAGGATASVNIPVISKSYTGIKAELVINGLNVGHSGSDINKNLLSAHTLLARVLFDACNANIRYHIIDLIGGTKDNVIPSLVKGHFIIEGDEDYTAFVSLLSQLQKSYREQYLTSDGGVTLTLKNNGSGEAVCLDDDSSNRIMNYMLYAPNGLYAMHPSIEGLPATSLNMGIMKCDTQMFEAGYSVRSSFADAKNNLCNQIANLSRLLGGNCELSGIYPAWQYNSESRLQKLLSDSYKNASGKDAMDDAIHAGVECGIFYDKMLAKGIKLDIISIGPDMDDIHTVKEKLSIPSTAIVYRQLVETLAAI